MSELNQEISPAAFDTTHLPAANYHIQIPDRGVQNRKLIVDFPYKVVVKGIRIQESPILDFEELLHDTSIDLTLKLNIADIRVIFGPMQ